MTGPLTAPTPVQEVIDLLVVALSKLIAVQVAETKAQTKTNQIADNERSESGNLAQ